MRARYTGTTPTSFEPPIGEVTAGAEFDLPRGREKAFLQHGLVEPADDEAQAFLDDMRKLPEPDAPVAAPKTKNTRKTATAAD